MLSTNFKNCRRVSRSEASIIVELKSNSKAGIALRHNSIENQTFNPDFPVSHPESDFQLYSGRDRSHSFHEASTQAGIRQVAPDRGGRTVDAQLHCDKTLHSR